MRIYDNSLQIGDWDRPLAADGSPKVEEFSVITRIDGAVTIQLDNREQGVRYVLGEECDLIHEMATKAAAETDPQLRVTKWRLGGFLTTFLLLEPEEWETLPYGRRS